MSDLTVCVVGLGKIGLPLAAQYASRGARVIGADINPEVVALVNRGEVPFHEEAGLAELVAEHAGTLLTATTDTTSAAAQADVVVVVVPLVVDDQKVPDFSALDAATAAVGAGIRAGTLVIYETTLPVFTTRRRFAPALSAASGLTPGEDLFVAFSPERVYSGRIFSDLRRYPKLVGGIDAASAEWAVAFYDRVLTFDDRPDLDRPNGVWDLGTAEAAELTKLAETTYRDINIAFANELAMFADRSGIDVYGVIEAANSQPFSHIHQPGIAVGGHCIPVYPHLYLAGDPDAKLPAAARAVNDGMPAYAVELLKRALGGSLESKRVLVLGLSYRPGVAEPANSGALTLRRLLAEEGAIALGHDPLIDPDATRRLGFEPFCLGDPADAAVLHTAHVEYATLTARDMPGVQAVIDGRACLDARTWEGATFLQLGAEGVTRVSQ